MNLFGIELNWVRNKMAKKGYKQTEEHKRKRGLFNLKRKTLEKRWDEDLAKVAKQKMCDNHWSKNGGIIWSKGLTKETDGRLAKASKNQSKTRKGKAHLITCICPFCEARRGKNNGKNNPMYGKIHSKKAKEAISKINKGNKYALGCKRSKKTREKISKNHADFSGSNHPNWKGGLKKFPYNFDFDEKLKLFIRKRDDFSCQFCGINENGKAYIPHHIDYDKMNSSKNNLILLCVSCNSKANYQREKWQFLFETLQEIRL